MIFCTLHVSLLSSSVNSVSFCYKYSILLNNAKLKFDIDRLTKIKIRLKKEELKGKDPKNLRRILKMLRILGTRKCFVMG